MINDKLTELLQPNDLNPPLDICAKAIGIENVLKLADKLPGKRITIPKKDVLLNPARKRAIQQDYKEGNGSMAVLAKKYDVSINTVSRYIHT